MYSSFFFFECDSERDIDVMRFANREQNEPYANGNVHDSTNSI